MGSLLAGLLIASCLDRSLFDFGAHFAPRVSLFITAGVRFSKFLVRKTALFWVQIPAPKWVRILVSVNVFSIKGPETVPISGPESVPKTGPFFGPGKTETEGTGAAIIGSC